MARTIKEIANGMKSDFIGNEDLCTTFGLTYDEDRTEDDRIAYYDANFSAVCVETCLIYIVATCAAALENMFDWFKEDVNNTISNERYGHKEWYVKKAKEYSYINTSTQQTVTPIAHASCEELNFGVRLKVAKSVNGVLCPLDDGTDNTVNEFNLFKLWMNRHKPAGMPIEYVNIAADTLLLKIDCHYDPLVFTGTIQDTKQDITDGINAYLNSIEFNGEFTTTALVDSLQKMEGLGAIEVIYAEAKYRGGTYSFFRSTYNPRSGYLELDSSSVIDLHAIN